MQLVAFGAQDIYLTGNPQITFFKVVYRRHTNFSMELIKQTWSGGNETTLGSRLVSTISRNGDLIHRMYIQTQVATNTAGYNPGAYFVDEVSVEIGGQEIDKHNGEFLEIYAELTEPNSASLFGVNSRGTKFQDMSGMGGKYFGASSAVGQFWIPLRFWFNKHVGLALPLIALQYHEVKVILKTYDGGASNTNVSRTCCWSTITQNNLWVEYIYLDTDERRRFAQVSHEYLIEQVQYESHSSALSMDLNFNHPVKELIWFNSIRSNTGLRGGGENHFKLVFNGHDRFEKLRWTYFTETQVWENKSGCGGLPRELTGVVTTDATASWSPTPDATGPKSLTGAQGTPGYGWNTGVYSFALKPEEHQPSGTCNFSRLDSVQLVQDVSMPLDIYAINYNVLRIMSGMGGLAYSN